MDIQTYASILLVIRLVSMWFIGSVLVRQMILFRYPIAKPLVWFRRTLFLLALFVFIGNIAPLIIDALTIWGDLTRSTRIVKPISLVYTIDAAGTALLSSVLIWTLYRLASGEKTQTDTTLAVERASEYKRGRRDEKAI